MGERAGSSGTVAPERTTPRAGQTSLTLACAGPTSARQTRVYPLSGSSKTGDHSINAGWGYDSSALASRCRTPDARLRDTLRQAGRCARGHVPGTGGWTRAGDARARRRDQARRSPAEGVQARSPQTLADGVALLTLRAGYEVVVEPGTELSIEYLFIFVTVGKLIVKA